MSDVYHLYLDESETHTNGKDRVFCIAGIIVKKEFHDNVLVRELNHIKKNLWGNVAESNNDYILHEKEIRFAQNKQNKYKLHQIDEKYRIFQYNKPSSILYKGLEKIINLPEITVIGGCVIEDEINRHYNRSILPEKQLIIMQIILENFCHFLQYNKAEGHIFYESIGEKADNIMRRRFNHIEIMGTMYVNPKSIQEHIINIHFPLKTDNVAGLQIADFIPNNIVRKVSKKQKHKFNLYDPIRFSRYDGGIMRRDKFGVKIIPRT